MTHVDQASPAAASGIAPGDFIVAAAPPESKMLLVSSAETSFFVALMREANPIFLRLKRGEHESTVCIQKVMSLAPRLPSPETVLGRTQAFRLARLCASFLLALCALTPKPYCAHQEPEEGRVGLKRLANSSRAITEDTMTQASQEKGMTAAVCNNILSGVKQTSQTTKSAHQNRTQETCLMRFGAREIRS